MSMIRDQSFGIQSQKSIPDTNIEMLNRDALTDFRNEVRHWKLIPHLDNVNDEEFCKGVGITDHAGQLTYGGLIMLGKSPYTFQFVPTFCADYVEIPGTGIEAITNNYTYRIPEQQNLWGSQPRNTSPLTHSRQHSDDWYKRTRSISRGFIRIRHTA